MRKRISVLVTLIIITLLGIIIILNNKNKEYEITDDNNGQFAFYYENDKGKYEISTESKWNTGEYILNLESSTCDGENNPSFLSWNNDNNSVTLTRNKATKCSLYFDKIVNDYNYTGNVQEFIPKHDGLYKIELWGASGGFSGTFIPGKGAYTTGLIYLKTTDKLYIYVGEEGISSMDKNSNNGTFNGGGSVGYCTRTTDWGGSGGGATDVRLLSGNWDEFNSLKSRIMVAAGGGAANSRGEQKPEGDGGSGGALKGFDGTSVGDADQGMGYGGTQTSGGKSVYYYNNYTQTASGFGYSDSIRTPLEVCSDKISNSENNWPYSTQSGGGGGYYGGGSSLHGGAGGGSSFISGYQGCVAIKDTSTQGNVIPKDNCTEETALNNIECSYHYSNMIFANANMIAGNSLMPSPTGGNETGHTGNGYARITLINNGNETEVLTKAVDQSGNHFDGEFIGNVKIQKDDEGKFGLYFDGNESYVDIADLPDTITWSDGFSYEFEAKWLAFNYFSRIIDFGNGAGVDNILFCNFETNNSVFPSVRYEGITYENNTAFTSFPLNQRIKIKVTYIKTNTGFKETFYKDGQVIREQNYNVQNLVRNVNRNNNYLGKSNWSNDAYFNGYIYNIKFTDSNGNPILWYNFS